MTKYVMYIRTIIWIEDMSIFSISTHSLKTFNCKPSSLFNNSKENRLRDTDSYNDDILSICFPCIGYDFLPVLKYSFFLILCIVLHKILWDLLRYVQLRETKN